MRRAVHIAVLLLIKRQFACNCRLRLVGGGGIIQINPIRMSGKKRKFSAKISSS